VENGLLDANGSSTTKCRPALTIRVPFSSSWFQREAKNVSASFGELPTGNSHPCVQIARDLSKGLEFPTSVLTEALAGLVFFEYRLFDPRVEGNFQITRLYRF